MRKTGRKTAPGQPDIQAARGLFCSAVPQYRRRTRQGRWLLRLPGRIGPGIKNGGSRT